MALENAFPTSAPNGSWSGRSASAPPGSSWPRGWGCGCLTTCCGGSTTPPWATRSSSWRWAGRWPGATSTPSANLPVPDHVEDLLGLRVADLDDAARRVLLALALDADLRVTQLPQPAGSAALAARRRGRGHVEGERVRPAHPLLAAAAQKHAPDEEKRDVTAGSPTWSPTSSAGPSTSPWPRRAPTRRSRHRSTPPPRGRRREERPAWRSTWRPTPAAHPAEVFGRRPGAGAWPSPHDAGEKQRLTELLGDRVESLPPGAPRVTAYPLLTEGAGGGQRRHPCPAGEGTGRGGRRPGAARTGPSTWRRTTRSSRSRRSPGRRAGHRGGRPERARQPRRPGARRQLAHLDPGSARAAGRSPGRRYHSLSTDRAHGPSPGTRSRAAADLAWRGRAARPMLTTFWDGPRSWARPTRLPGCTCASWSSGRAVERRGAAARRVGGVP